MFDIFFVQQLVNGLSVGFIYALMAIGFTLIFGVLNVVNFAHGEIYTIGAFAGLLLINAIAPPWWVVGLVVLAIGAFSGFALERLAFRPFRRFRDEASLKSRAMREATLLSSLAVSIVIREGLELKFSGEMQPIAQQYLLQKPIQLGPVSIADGNLVIFGLSVLMLGALQWVLRSWMAKLLGVRLSSWRLLSPVGVGLRQRSIPRPLPARGTEPSCCKGMS